jgi:hypothetical protein
MFLAGFNLVNLLNRIQVHWIYGQAVKGIGRHRNDVTLPQAGDNVVDPVGLRFVGMDA